MTPTLTKDTQTAAAPASTTLVTAHAPSMNSLVTDSSTKISAAILATTKTVLTKAGYAVPSDHMICAMHAALINDSDLNKSSDRWLADAIRGIQGMGVKAKEIDATVERFLGNYLRGDQGFNKALDAFLCGKVEHPDGVRYNRNGAGTQRVTVIYDKNWKAVVSV